MPQLQSSLLLLFLKVQHEGNLAEKPPSAACLVFWILIKFCFFPEHLTKLADTTPKFIERNSRAR
jgi:hypothetical protein